MHASSLENMQKCFERYVCGLFVESRDTIHVLDVGGADVNGSYADIFSSEEFEYLAADIAPGPGVGLVLEDPYEFPLADGSFDLVISGQAFEHVEFFWSLFEEMVRVVGDDGFIFLIAPSAGPIHRYPVDCYRFYPDAYEALARYAGIRLVDCWHDERGPWKDLVGVFSKAPFSPPSPDELLLRRRAQPATRYLREQLPAATEIEPAGEEAERVAGQEPYLETLDRVHGGLEPRFYLEIGVRRGDSLSLARGPAIGVDPEPELAVAAGSGSEVYEQTSDFFFEHSAERALADRPLDLVFLDGMHLFEFALRDFMNVERRAHAATVVVIDDVFPNHPLQASRTRASRVWTGDVWRLYHCLRCHRPDLRLLALDAAPTGLLLVTGLDRENRSLWEAYNPLVRFTKETGLEEAGPAVCRREGAITPADGRLEDWLQDVRRLRERDLPEEQTRAAIRTSYDRIFGERSGDPTPGSVQPVERKPSLSVVIVVYDMEREAPRTLHSLSTEYQRGIGAEDYEVIVVDNGSTRPLAPESVRAFGPGFRYLWIDEASPSPAAAMNRGVAEARGKYVGLMIDGARIVTPGMLQGAMACLEGFHRPIVGTLGFHLGPDAQIRSHPRGYDQRVEDELLAGIDWPRDGYRLFEIAALAESSLGGWFGSLSESNCVFLPRELFAELGGFDEAFDAPGGGLVNPDFWARACELPSSTLIMLLGEASFHQFHGGAATGLTEEELAVRWPEWNAEYARLRGRGFAPPTRAALLCGRLHDACLPWVRRSCEAGAGAEVARERRVADLERALGAAESELTDARERLAAVLGSRSWRLTAPMRRLRARLGSR